MRTIETMMSFYFSDIPGDPGVIEHATPAAVLAFANEVRAAGNAGLLDALLPSVPQRPRACLIARALNFESVIRPDSRVASWLGEWRMYPQRASNGLCLNDNNKAIALATKLNLDTHTDANGSVGIVLPREIGNAAFAFDRNVTAFKDWVSF